MRKSPVAAAAPGFGSFPTGNCALNCTIYSSAVAISTYVWLLQCLQNCEPNNEPECVRFCQRVAAVGFFFAFFIEIYCIFTCHRRRA